MEWEVRWYIRMGWGAGNQKCRELPDLQSASLHSSVSIFMVPMSCVHSYNTQEQRTDTFQIFSRNQYSLPGTAKKVRKGLSSITVIWNKAWNDLLSPIYTHLSIVLSLICLSRFVSLSLSHTHKHILTPLFRVTALNISYLSTDSCRLHICKYELKKVACIFC